MAVKLFVYALSLLLFCVFVYIIGSLWFRGKRNRMLISFSALGLLYSFWVLSNGINVLLSHELFTTVNPYLPQTLVCVVPAVLLIYVLQFTESGFARKRWVLRLLFALILFDLLLLWTNPLHNEFISGYDEMTPLTGKLFPIHALISYSPVILAVIILYIYIARNIRKKPFLGLVGIGTVIPLMLNILYTFHLFDIGFDLTPFAFILMYGTFTAYSIRMRLFDIKETTASELFDSLSDALIVVDRMGFISSVNPAFKKEFPDIEILRDKTPVAKVAEYMKSIATEFSPPDMLAKMFSNGPDKVDGAEITVSKGALHNYSLSKDIISDNGYYTGYIIAMTDISNYRQMIDMITELKIQADSASSAKGLFLSNMSHEIRTPLNAIIGMINIGMSATDAERKEYCLERADSASKQLLGIINDVLDISKIEAGKFELSYSELDFEKLLVNVVNVANIRAEEKQQNLVINLNESVPVCIEGDELRLAQVITNLLTNAIKFTPDKGKIVLSAEAIEETDTSVVLRIEVADNGIGISEEQQKRLFTSYNQANAGITKKFGGTGLGLAISKRIVELMGGEIWIESELGKGAKFIFTIKATKLVCGKDYKIQDNIHNETSGGSYDFHSYTILIAEDVDINREILSAVLEETGISIDFAEDGKIAVNMFRDQPEKYNLILMDVNMPEMDGYEATREIRALDKKYAKDIPIIAMTANVFKEDIDRCLESGMNAHIGKPVDMNALFGLLRSHLTNAV